MLKKILLLFTFVLSNILADGLEGTIKDHSNQKPVQGAIIWLEGTNFIDTTNVSGYYQITNIPTGTYTIIIQHSEFVQKVYTDFLIDQTVGVNNQIEETPTDFNLEQNYPNPFNPTTNISFQLPQSVHVNLRIYNTLGKLVAELIDNWKQAGNYNITWNATDLNGNLVPSGIYFYQITAGKYTYSKKMILMK